MMQAVYATGIDADAPLGVLAIGERPEPELPAGWARVQVRAASLNHHDLWTLRGVGVRPEHVGTPLGTDAAGVTDDGREVIVHAVLGSAGPGDDETLAPDLHLLSEAGVSGTHAEVVAAPGAQPGAQARGPELGGGGLPADRLPDGLPHAVHPRRPAPGRARAHPGRRRRRRDRGDHPGPRRRDSRCR